MRIAITGIGAISALGGDVAAHDEALRAGRSGIGPLTRFPPSQFRTHLAAEAPEPQLPEPPDGDARRVAHAPQSRGDALGLRAAIEAVARAGLDAQALEGAACVFGTGTGGAQLTEDWLAQTRTGASPSPAALVAHQPCSVTDLVTRRLGIFGPRSTIMTACSSSATAIGYAADLLRLGRAEVALAGGAEGLCRLTLAGFNALRAVSPEPCRPFDRDRKGLTLGEAGACLVLETEAHARRRGADILGFLAGWGITADAHHMTAPHPEGDGAARALLAALASAGVAPDAVDYVNAHGTGTAHNDAAEAHALARVFGDGLARVPVSSTKSMHGHTLGAAGALEAVATILAMRGGYVPPTSSLETVDPAFPPALNLPTVTREADIHFALSTSLAFGGNNTALLFAAPT